MTQIYSQIIVSLLIQIFSFSVRPFKNKFAHRMELFNELSVLALVYLLMCFTDFVSEADSKYFIGYFYCGVSILNIAVHLFFILIETFKKSRKDLKKYCKKRAVKKRQNIEKKWAKRDK